MLSFAGLTDRETASALSVSRAHRTAALQCAVFGARLRGLTPGRRADAADHVTDIEKPQLRCTTRSERQTSVHIKDPDLERSGSFARGRPSNSVDTCVPVDLVREIDRH